jgi:hypothetical protein
MLIYDCEIAYAIPNRGEEPIPGIKYCKGWHDHVGMGISCIGVYDYATDRYRVFLRDNLQEFAELVKTEQPLISYNGIGFDNKLLAAFNINIPAEHCYDILAELWKAAGPGRHKGFKLDQVCAAALGVHKSGSGALAPVLWQQVKLGQVIDYCLNDVAMTKKLFDYLRVNHGRIPDPRDTTKTLLVPGVPL